ncbi:MAG: diacylglycerol kinase family lipid kinase [Clostridia bacterium]|nr:diacylglycerol kinase family lipid kinase [Clostridia bacterium]
MKHVFIINPNAGENNAFGFISKSLEPFKENYEIILHKTSKAKNATEFVKEFASSNPNEEIRFYACGGDGTLNEVVNGAMGFKNASVSLYPSGSGNDFVKSLKNPTNYLDIKKLLDATNKEIDVLEINGNLYCINVCNFGFDAIVAKTANELKEKGKKNAYTKGIIKALFNGMKNQITVEVDGKVLNESGKLLLANSANGAYYGGKYKCAPNYVLDDGLIEVCLVKPVSVFTFLKLVKKYELGNHLTDKKFDKFIIYLRGKTVKMYSKKPFVVSIDGEIISGTEFTVKILEKSLKFGIIS